MGWLLHNRHVSVVHAFSQEAEGQDETLKHFIGKSEYADRLHVIRGAIFSPLALPATTPCE